MQFDISDRGEGRTTRLATWLVEGVGSRVVVTMGERPKADMLRLVADKLNTTPASLVSTYPVVVVTFEQFQHGVLDGKPRLEIAFDNIDHILQNMAGAHKVVVATARQDRSVQ